MSVFLRIPSEPTWIIMLDDEDDSEYNVPRWGNGVECDNTTCGKCGTKIGPYTTTKPSGQLDIYGHAIMEPVIEWIPVYHQYDYDPRPLLCRDCAEATWWHYRENLLLVAEYTRDVDQILDMLEKPWKYTDDWWVAFAVEQDEFFATHPAETGVPG